MINCLKDEVLDGSRINSTGVSTAGRIIDVLFATKLPMQSIFSKMNGYNYIIKNMFKWYFECPLQI